METAIDRMGDRKAAGVCSWHPSDLKILPRKALTALIALFSKAVTLGLPTHLLHTRIALLSKVANPTSIRQSRPINVFSVLYRIWSSVLTRQVLRGWSARFPASVFGSMPGRSSRDLSWLLQADVELQALLARLQIPREVVAFWRASMRQARCYPALAASLQGPLFACTGAPEGDPFSVVAMAAICWMLHELLFCLQAFFFGPTLTIGAGLPAPLNSLSPQPP